LNVNKVEEKIQSFRRGSLKTVFYIAFLVILLSVLNFVFNPPTTTEDGEVILLLPPFLQPYEDVIRMVQPYLSYIQAGLIFVIGYLAVNAISKLIYTYMRRISDHPTAAAVRSISRISGIAILLSLMASVFQVNAAAALTVGSFGGLVVGFATQTILSNVVAGVFLLVSRPFTYGDTVTVAGQTGQVKEIRLMHLVLETEDREILIPSGTIVTQIIQKKRPPLVRKPVETVLTLEVPPSKVTVGSAVKFVGRLVEAATKNPVPGATIKIFDSDVRGDDLLASGATGNDGSFNVEWRAKRTDWQDNTAEIYAKFEGNNGNRESQSKQYVVTLKKTHDKE
jgi:hypothetical protein